MSYQQAQEMYHDNSSARSPGSQRHQQPLHRQPSRQFDAYGPMPVNLYEDPMARYDTGRLERLNPSLHNNYAYDLSGSQTWNPNGFANAQALGGIRSASTSLKTSSSRTGRAGIPTTWLDQPPPMPSPFSNLGPGPLQSSAMRPETTGPSETDDELIPTAIVIKNIPFAVKKEQLVQLMTELSLPLPYAFNYHFDNGVFRGLAFANFTSAEETATVIDVLNHFELQGRKLRVEYKKMLPLQERERIEREKRERRGQLEEQHRPMAATSQLQTQSSMSSLTSHLPATSPSPVSQRGQKLGKSRLPGSPLHMTNQDPVESSEVDLNDSTTLSYYSQLLLFKEDTSRDSMVFAANLSPVQRRTVHTLAHNMGLGHASRGSGDQRQVQVFKVGPGANVSPPLSSIPAAVQPSDTARRGLNRAATIDFSEARNEGPSSYNTLRGQTSGFLGVLDSPGNFGNTQNLRAAKSFADLRSYTPSPVPSSASFPAALQSNGARMPHYDGATSATSNTPTLTPAPSGSSLGMPRDDGLLVNSLSSLSLGTGIGGPNSSPRRLRSMFSWEQPESQPSSAGPIGSNRSIGLGFDGQSQERMPIRQPRGPLPEKGPGFRRPNGHQPRGSDELRTNSGVEIIVE
ncbi:putative R3H domain protein [Aspergillus melleus]|uniref:putative R3H domain protein n=1 Tax=Aspergillus melleus TaxID=138277 RepID=UPI001E8DC509|nr:Peptidyl-prolyl cis-trans isomerase pin4 [Aspergillus melleus]KAH8430801.1 Peptidyl-prolyl cis-trans isomerase pin4 [Aspergillus melleus]